MKIFRNIFIVLNIFVMSTFNKIRLFNGLYTKSGKGSLNDLN